MPDIAYVAVSIADGNEQPPIAEELSSRLQQFKGRWVAVDQDEVVADGESAGEVLKLARERGHTDPLVFRVSSSPERLAFF
jgi:hypothetical protein